MKLSDDSNKNPMSNEVFSESILALFKERWITVDMLCEELFERSNMTKLHPLIIKRIEEELGNMTSPDNLRKIEISVNKYMDSIMGRLREQCPWLSSEDLKFVLLIYAGLSTRSVCFFCDLKLKNFYTKRRRIADRILSSEATDKASFVSLLGVKH